MAQNQAVLVTYLKDILFSEEDIIKAVANREHIFQMKDMSGTSLGFISLYDLKAYVSEHEDEAGSYTVRNIDGLEWLSLFEHPLFQRRKPQLVAAPIVEADNDQQYFILKHGQKTGPFNKNQITEMLDEKHLLLTDMVSHNGGYTWAKLFQVEGFDRRVLKESEQLPGIPTEALAHGSDAVSQATPSTEAISSLAYLSNLKRGKTVEKAKIETYQADKAVQSGGNSMHKWLIIVAVIGIGYFLFHIKNQLNSPFKNGPSPVGEHDAEVLTPVDMSKVGERPQVNRVNDGQRTQGKFSSRPMRPVQPRAKKSFMDTPKYNDVKQPDAPEDPNYFYDNTSAMELDPVRSQVSKENFDNGGADSSTPAAEGTPAPASADTLFENEATN
jgi:hypothetical protein